MVVGSLWTKSVAMARKIATLLEARRRRGTEEGRRFLVNGGDGSLMVERAIVP